MLGYTVLLRKALTLPPGGIPLEELLQYHLGLLTGCPRTPSYDLVVTHVVPHLEVGCFGKLPTPHLPREGRFALVEVRVRFIVFPRSVSYSPVLIVGNHHKSLRGIARGRRVGPVSYHVAIRALRDGDDPRVASEEGWHLLWIRSVLRQLPPELGVVLSVVVLEDLP